MDKYTYLLYNFHNLLYGVLNSSKVHVYSCWRNFLNVSYSHKPKTIFHFRISLSNMIADVKVGLVLVDDAFSFINPAIEFIHDEVLVKVSFVFTYSNNMSET